MASNKKLILNAGLVLGLFSFIGIGLVSFTYALTQQQIAENERLFVLKNLRELVPEHLHDNDLLADSLQVSDTRLFKNERTVTLYRAFKGEHLVAMIAQVTAPDGYNGSIKLLVAIQENGQLMGVRAVSHHETPGLGDAIDTNKSDWVFAFNGHSLSDPTPAYWKVKRDGGVFDQFTGATITPRAVVKTVLKTLQYYQAHKQTLTQAAAVSHE
jgi:electron transport complex protein RnfG|tara:strand:- start:6162 stop:6800 length:639 start_codon:yes stop_codon:yes gene_type:complete